MYVKETVQTDWNSVRVNKLQTNEMQVRNLGQEQDDKSDLAKTYPNVRETTHHNPFANFFGGSEISRSFQSKILLNRILYETQFLVTSYSNITDEEFSIPF